MYSYDVIVNERTDTLAKEMNLRWSGNKNKNAANEEWNKATIFSQDSSRGAAEGVSNTLKLLNMQYVSKNTKVNPMNIIDKDKFEEKISSVIDVLAENEHKRWNAFHFTQGIKLWDFTTVTYEEFCMCSSKKTNQVEECNKHAALIAYPKLPELDAKINGYAERWSQEHPQQKPIKLVNNQNNDKSFVQDIPTFISQIDCEIVLRR